MERQIKIGNVLINYELIRSPRKTVGIAVKPDGRICVSAPQRISLDSISEVLKSKARWIIEKKAQVDEQQKNNPAKLFISGEVFMYLGESYRLDVNETGQKQTTVGINCGKLEVKLGLDVDKKEICENVRGALLAWLVEQARHKISERLEFYGRITGLYPKKVYIKEQKTRWGSCTKDNKLNFNWKIVMAPVTVIDYLVVHELCHIRVKNHSKQYWDLVSSILPGYKKDRAWLKQNGAVLNL